MMPVSEPLQIKRARVRATEKAGYLVGGQPVRPGDESECDLVDAVTLRRSGKAEIVGEAPSRSIPVRDLVDPPPGVRGRP